MCSRLILRSIQFRVPLLIGSRFLSLTPIRSIPATKLNEKKPTDDVSSSQDQVGKPSANVPDINKTYSDKIHRIVGEISKLSLVEVMDLNELLKVNHGVNRESFT